MNTKIRKEALKLIPPLLDKFHKGQLGRILIVGGCEDYTGAPYFSCMASALVGADMNHIMCSKDAGVVIKGYSPNLMVHPYLLEGEKYQLNKLPSKITALLDRIHVVVVGPGLGRDEAMIAQAEQIIREARNRNLPLVVDADGLYVIQQNLDLIKGADAILTPNIVEFGRLVAAANIDAKLQLRQRAEALASKLGNLTVIIKGDHDIITNGKDTLVNDLEGSPRRVSGQGDTLSGAVATFLGWRQAYKQGLWDTNPIDLDLSLVAAYAASSVTRTASRLAYAENGRSMVTTDVTKHVGPAFKTLFT